MCCEKKILRLSGWESPLLSLSSFLVLGLASCTPVPVSSQYPSQLERSNTVTVRSCEDFLEKWKKKPRELHYLKCQEEKSAQLKVVVAHYTVEGKNAAKVESFLSKNFGMAALGFVCCGWSPRILRDRESSLPGDGKYFDNGFRYEVTMLSGETGLSRQNWHQLPQFQVRVTKFLEEP
jgi:Domian of unknown function (DUF4952)